MPEHDVPQPADPSPTPGDGGPSPSADPRVLRAIAHPVRARILDELGATGPMRAADVAAQLGIPANQASFHLRQLAKYGLVTEAPEAARDGRDRVWKAVAEDGLSLSVSELERQPGGKAAIAVWRRNTEAWAHQVIAAAYGERHAKNTQSAISSTSIRLTKAEARELADDLDEVVLRWRHRQRDSEDADRITYLLYSVLQPYPDGLGDA